jgi:hypothetical protein
MPCISLLLSSRKQSLANGMPGVILGGPAFQLNNSIDKIDEESEEATEGIAA